MALKALLLPDFKTSIAITHIARIAAYPNGVGIFNMREKMIGWIACTDENIAADIVYELSELMNNPGRAKHPDWQLLMKQDKGN